MLLIDILAPVVNSKESEDIWYMKMIIDPL